jgi:hypothetical protein
VCVCVCAKPPHLEQSKRFLLQLAARTALISDGMVRSSRVGLADMALRKEKNSEA